MIFRPKTNSHSNFQDREDIQNTEVKHLKKLIKSRRGVAIELAIGVMFLMIAFTIMLLSTAGLQNDHRVDDYRDFKEKIEVDNIGEYVVANRGSYDGELKKVEIDIEYENTYSAKVVDNKYEIYRVDGEELELVLTIELNADNTIKSWK